MNKTKALVLVDIYSWVAACITHRRIVHEGIYRHAEMLARTFTPAVCVSAAEDTGEFRAELISLERYLKKPIRVFFSAEHLFMAHPNVWLSIGLDAASPVLPELKGKVYRVAVLHDTFAAEGLFGAGNVETYHRGALNNDMLLPVSRTALFMYQNRCLVLDEPMIEDKLDYGCFHQYAPGSFGSVYTGDEGGYPAGMKTIGLSVSTVYPRKRVYATAQASLKQNYGHNHIGRFVAPECSPEQWAELLKQPNFRLIGAATDNQLTYAYATAARFYCLSENEGFSMTPLEAIIHGVPEIYLSDIPAHAEIYGDYSVNFESEPGGKYVPATQARDLFERYTFDKVIAPFLSFLND